MKDFERLYNRLMELNGDFDFSIATNRRNRFVNLFFHTLTLVDFDVIKSCGYKVLSVSPSNVGDCPINVVLF